MRRLLFLIVLLTLSAAAPAKLYKWVDKDGNVTYSEVRPPGVDAQEVRLLGVSAPNPQPKDRVQQLNEKADEAAKDREFKENYASETAERDARLAENCETARQNLRVLETASRVKDAEGNYIDDQTREKRLAQTRQDIENNCQ